MSLDVTLVGGSTEIPCACSCGHKHMKSEEAEHFSANITHNLNKMADAAGIYQAIWRPEEIAAVRARDLIVPLTAGLAGLRLNPEKFKAFNPGNKWGDYKGFVAWVERYLNACIEHPDARIRAER